MLTPGQTLELSIDKPAAGGRMIARVEGQVVLVAGTLPGEQVSARVERVGRGVAYAETLSVTTASADRRPVDFDSACGGCLYAHITYGRQLTIKALVVEDAFGRIGRMALPGAVAVHGSPEDGYRMRARLHVRGGQLGFFREGTHEICDPKPTRQLADETCAALDRLAAGLRSLGMAGVGELELAENIDLTQRVVHLETGAPVSTRVLSGLGASEGLTGLTVAAAARRGPRAAVVAGDPRVTDVLQIDGRGVHLQRHVLSFFQGNRFLLPALVAHVMARIGRGDRVVDLYAGAGLFSVAAAATRAASVIAVEGDRGSAEDLGVNAAVAGQEVSAVHEPVEAFVRRRHEPPQVLIVDPPRTGMSADALQGALSLGAATLVYVSCDVPTLARDARRLVDAGYRLDDVTAFDLFPNTPHVEAVATFCR